jgi:hypothetical protein
MYQIRLNALYKGNKLITSRGGQKPAKPVPPAQTARPIRLSVHEHIYGRIWIRIFFLFGFRMDNGFKVFGWVST